MKKLSWFKVICIAIPCAMLAIASPSIAQTLTTLANFGDGASDPHATLAQGADGNFYGTTVSGGNDLCNPQSGCGTVFKVTSSGVLTILHSFCVKANCADGSGPLGGLVLGTDQSFYGTTFTGGSHNCSGPVECGGTIFKITPEGKLTVLYSFCSQTNCADGEYPSSALVLASNGDFYGTAAFGGEHGGGTIFKVTPQGKLTTLYSFCMLTGCTDGVDPIGGLFLGSDGALYGTTYGDGAFGYGTIYKLSSSGQFTTLHSFDFSDGANPTAGLIQASNGKFYGATQYGGDISDGCGGGCGTLFAITAAGKFSLLDVLDWNNGFQPYSPIIQATDGNLYGTTVMGVGAGTVFDMTPGGKLTSLFAFGSDFDGTLPFGGLVQSTNGVFYGTTAGGGSSSNGTVFSLDNDLGPFVALVIPTGKVSQVAQMLGQGFSGTRSVTFNGVPATSFKVVSDTYLTAIVPSGATSGKVLVTTPTGTLSSNVNFRITK